VSSDPPSKPLRKMATSVSVVERTFHNAGSELRKLIKNKKLRNKYLTTTQLQYHAWPKAMQCFSYGLRGLDIDGKEYTG